MDGDRIVSIYCKTDPDNEDNTLVEVINEALGTKWENEANFIIRSYASVLTKIAEKTNNIEIREVNECE